MSLARDPMGAAEGRAMLDQLPELYFAILKTAHIEQHSDAGIRCSFELPILGKRTKAAPTARDAIRAVLVELAEVLTKTPTSEWPKDWYSLVLSVSPTRYDGASGRSENPRRFQSKPRQFTIGVTMPTKLKLSLQSIAEQQETSFSDVARQIAMLGFEDFDERIFTEGSEDLLSAFCSEMSKWHPSKTEQLMVRLDPHLAVRLRSTAKEFRRSASEFLAMCLAHGLVLQTLLADLEEKIAAVRGSKIRQLAPKVGFGIPVPLLSGVLAGSIGAPKLVLKRLSEVFQTPAFALTVFFRRSFDSVGVPAFKAETGKPQVLPSATPWEDAVKSLKLPPAQTKELLLLDR